MHVYLVEISSDCLDVLEEKLNAKIRSKIREVLDSNYSVRKTASLRQLITAELKMVLAPDPRREAPADARCRRDVEHRHSREEVFIHQCQDSGQEAAVPLRPVQGTKFIGGSCSLGDF